MDLFSAAGFLIKIVIAVPSLAIGAGIGVFAYRYMLKNNPDMLNKLVALANKELQELAATAATKAQTATTASTVTNPDVSVIIPQEAIDANNASQIHPAVITDPNTKI